MKSSVLNRDLADLVSDKSERLRIFLGVITDAHENLRRITLKSFLKKFSATQYCGRSGGSTMEIERRRCGSSRPLALNRL
jgi:hypothetical protein